MAGSTTTTRGFWRYVALLTAPAGVVGVLLFLVVMGWLVVDAVTADQGPGEIPKFVGVVVLIPVAAVGSALAGAVAAAMVAPFRFEGDDPFRRPASGISAAIVLGSVGFVAWALKDLWLH